MKTYYNSVIGIMQWDGTILIAKCRSSIETDTILFEHYNKIEKIKELINIGYIRTLEADIKDISILCQCDPLKYKTFDDFLFFVSTDEDTQITYLFDEPKNKWYYVRNNDLIDLENEVKLRNWEKVLGKMLLHQYEDTYCKGKKGKQKW